MIVLEVTAYDGQPLAHPLTAQFDELGGTIGRGEASTLLLADPEKTISRTHASLTYRAGDYVLLDQGSTTPVFVNGRPLGRGKEAVVSAGDELRVGPYAMVVKSAAMSRVSPIAAGDPASTQPPVRAAGGLPNASPMDDPMGMFGGEAGSLNPLADLLSPTPRITAPRPTKLEQSRDLGTAAGAVSKLPEDFDPFAEPSATSSAPSARSGAQTADPGAIGLGSLLGAEPSVNKLFDLVPGSGSDPFPSGHPLAEPPSRANTVGDSDPLRALIGKNPAPSTVPPQRDDVPDIHAAFVLPKTREPPREARVKSDPDTPSVMRSWDDAGGGRGDGIKTVILGGGAATQVASASRDPVPGDPTALAPLSGPAARSPDRDELLQSFLAGAGVPDLNISGALTPQLMHVFGQLVRESTRGTLDLLNARALAKRELRAAVTMVIARDNNPLKFSPNVEAALAHLLNPQGRGFMTPLRAMRDAYDDLRAHQIATMAGMRAALAGVLSRFDPQRLERRLTEKSVIDSVIPMNRKAKLWDLFEQLFGDLSHEAEGDFDALFGKEFLRAYEEALDQIDREHAARPNGS